MECKSRNNRHKSDRLSVLISTYWNVKQTYGDLPLLHKGVLISTYWNVKPDIRWHRTKHVICFNLNLLECKTQKAITGSYTHCVLISTYWNVKEWNGNRLGSSDCFNLNLLECKRENDCFSYKSTQVLISTYWNVKVRNNLKVQRLT